MKCVVTHTDTFGGEANYAWVKRHEFLPKNPESQRSIVRRVKELTGFTGVRCDTENWGDSLTIKPRGYHQVILVDFE